MSIAPGRFRRLESITAEVNSLGGALMSGLLTPGEAEQIRGLDP
jgi:hypothetical protein